MVVLVPDLGLAVCLLGRSRVETWEKKLHVFGDVFGDACRFLMAAWAVAVSWARSAHSTALTCSLPPQGQRHTGHPAETPWRSRETRILVENSITWYSLPFF